MTNLVCSPTGLSNTVFYRCTLTMSNLLLFLLCLIAFALCIPLILHWVYRAPRVVEQTTPKQHGMVFSEHRLAGEKQKGLHAWLIKAGKSNTTLVVVHGWGANAEMMLPLAQPFYQAGMDVLLYDARNHGKSDSDSFSSLPRFAEDLGTAVAWLKQRNPHQRLVVLGHSIGSAAAILAASQRDDIDLVIGLSGFAHPSLVMRRQLDRPWLPRFLRNIIMDYIQWVIGFRFDDIAPMNRIPHVHCPVLLAHGTEDRVVPISDMRLIEANAPPQISLRILEITGARHDSLDHFLQHADKLIAFIHTSLETPLDQCFDNPS
jgi:alpha-beta hydrolase superfamily lysophospholipase